MVVGSLDGRGLRIGVVCSRFNELISERLLAGALDGLRRHGVAEADVTTVWVPGAFELPLAALTMARRGSYDALITLGAVIRGATSHYDLVSAQAASGVARAALDTGVPVVFGVLTTDTVDQALERAGSKAGNKGFDSAATAIEMADVLRRLVAG
ncbi:MAG: 6,7-dimethyl-8-ribityllumazine synthase [Actinomycetota bacterium]|nr:6,7-dimethyl-8-ribityllumazine synthase [Actinomycetota bacterium]